MCACSSGGGDGGRERSCLSPFVTARARSHTHTHTHKIWIRNLIYGRFASHISHTSKRAARAGVSSSIRAEQDYDWLAAGVNKAMMDLRVMAAAGPRASRMASTHMDAFPIASSPRHLIRSLIHNANQRTGLSARRFGISSGGNEFVQRRGARSDSANWTPLQCDNTWSMIIWDSLQCISLQKKSQKFKRLNKITFIF